MENGFTSQSLSHPALVLAGLPEALRMQLGPFNPQLQDAKGLNLHSLNASAFRLRYAHNYPGFPAHLIHHLQPQLFSPAVDPRAVHFTAGAFRPFNVASSPNKLFPSAFAPPHKPDVSQDLSPGSYGKLFSSENDEESSFRSERESDHCEQSSKGDQTCERNSSRSGSTSPKSTSVKEEKTEGSNAASNAESDASNISTSEDDRALRRNGKVQFDPTCCPICGIMVLLGEAEAHFFKELERLSQVTVLDRDRKFLFDKTHGSVHPCFSAFSNSYAEENGHTGDNGMPRGRWETYQRIKSNRLSRLRIKNRRRRAGDPLCPVCNEKMQGSVEDINLHVEHCLKKHSDEGDEDEDENIDVEGDSEVYGDYEWAAGLLSTTNANNQRTFEKEDPHPGDEDSPAMTSIHLGDHDVHMTDDDSPHDKDSRDTDHAYGGMGKCITVRGSGSRCPEAFARGCLTYLDR